MDFLPFCLRASKIEPEGASQMPFVTKAWEDLTIRDDFMFKAVMYSKELCMGVLEAILNEPIHDIKYLGEEVSLKAGYASNGVRLDVYVEDDAHTVYNVEMQVGAETDEEIAKRMRYYQAQIDAEILKSGKDYSELRQTIIIFICPFDPIGRGWHLYWYENTCRRDATLKLKDGAIKIILNTRGTGDDISPQLRAFMDYVNRGILSSNPLVQAIDKRLKEVKQNEEARLSYMTLEMKLRDVRKDGLDEGKALMMRIWKLLQAKTPFADIAEETHVSIDEVRQIAQDYGIVY